MPGTEAGAIKIYGFLIAVTSNVPIGESEVYVEVDHYQLNPLVSGIEITALGEIECIDAKS